MSNPSQTILRIRSRDGLERLTLPNPNITISQLKSLIETHLKIPISHQTLSTNQNLLLSKTLEETHRLAQDMSNPKTPMSSLGISHGSIVYLAYNGERSVTGPRVTNFTNKSSNRKMTINDLIAKQVRVSRQEKPHCESVSIDRDAANAFQRYVNESLGFAIKRGGFMYGKVLMGGKVVVDFIYEPPQNGSETDLVISRDFEEEKRVEAIAQGLGLRKVGFVFTQTASQVNKEYTLSNLEVLQAAEMQGESGVKEWVTVVVKLGVGGDGGADVCFEAFQLSDVCVRLFKEGWFERNCGGEVDPKVLRMKKDVVVGGKDTKEVDNDFFLTVVKILDHQGSLSSNFSIENRSTPFSSRALKNHLDRTKSLPFVKRISDFHLLLLLARYLDLNVDVPSLAECVKMQTPVPEGYQLLIESMASAA